MMRCEKVLVLVMPLTTLGVAASGGLLVGLKQEQSWCLFGGRLRKEGDEVGLMVKVQLLHFDIALGFFSFCFMHHHSSFTHHPLFFY